MADTTDEIVRRLTRGQLGLFTRDQALAEGVSLPALRHRVDTGALERLSDTVFRLGGAPDGVREEVMAAVLDAGPLACASHWTAAALWGLPGSQLLPVHVTARRSTIRKTEYLATVHQPRSLLRPHLAVRYGIPVTSPARTLFDVAGLPSVHPKKVERLVDTALACNLATVGRLQRTLEMLARRGRRGISLMRQLIDERADDYRPPESGLEFRFRELARRAGLRDLARQVDIGDEQDWIGRVDFVDRARGIIIETDTVLHHGSITDRRRDGLRRDRLRADGWTVLAFTDVDVFHRSDEVVRLLRAAIRTSSQLAG